MGGGWRVGRIERVGGRIERVGGRIERGED